MMPSPLVHCVAVPVHCVVVHCVVGARRGGYAVVDERSKLIWIWVMCSLSYIITEELT